MKKIVFFALVILLLAACGPGLENQVIGKWERVEGELWPDVVDVDLQEGGDAFVTMAEGAPGREVERYEWSVEEKDFCENWIAEIPTCYQMELDGDVMTLLDIRAQHVTLKKVK